MVWGFLVVQGLITLVFSSMPTLNEVALPAAETFAGHENFTSAMQAFGHYARRENKPYLMAWNPWQKFGSLMRGLYTDSAPPGKNLESACRNFETV